MSRKREREHTVGERMADDDAVAETPDSCNSMS